MVINQPKKLGGACDTTELLKTTFRDSKRIERDKNGVCVQAFSYDAVRGFSNFDKR